jgi:hypothetical protein
VNSACACVREIHLSAYEDEIARRWWALQPGTILPLSDGGSYQLLFAGHPGGSCGPDVRDAVLCGADGVRAGETTQRGTHADQCAERVGDVEFHIRSSDWELHQHHSDPRYNNVILHVVLLCDDPHPTLRQDGVAVPVCSLYDLAPPPALSMPVGTVWPCQLVMRRFAERERFDLLRWAGLQRFEQKTHAFVEQLHAADPCGPLDLYDVCLITALAEGLGYGRDRAFFRAVGQRLTGVASSVPEPLGRAPQPSPLDARRLRVLRTLVESWRLPGAWRTLRKLLLAHTQQTRILQALRAPYLDAGLSLARTDILLCNVVLPFAAAVALLEHDEQLAQRAQKLYEMHPGLASNRVTRVMCAQLQLPEEPRGSCQQQGLHYIYQQTCREKHCSVCIVGKMDV